MQKLLQKKCESLRLKYRNKSKPATTRSTPTKGSDTGRIKRMSTLSPSTSQSHQAKKSSQSQTRILQSSKENLTLPDSSQTPHSPSRIPRPTVTAKYVSRTALFSSKHDDATEQLTSAEVSKTNQVFILL